MKEGSCEYVLLVIMCQNESRNLQMEKKYTSMEIVRLCLYILPTLSSLPVASDVGFACTFPRGIQ